MTFVQTVMVGVMEMTSTRISQELCGGGQLTSLGQFSIGMPKTIK